MKIFVLKFYFETLFQSDRSTLLYEKREGSECGSGRPKDADLGGPKTSGSGTLVANITFRLLFFVIIISFFSLQDKADGMFSPENCC
jgi:hypothetical protein